ncbi:hypothetical protein A2U01_0100018, partial [Trifolium medium]|nr:hypothetical protein [Trifolium medium]
MRTLKRRINKITVTSDSEGTEDEQPLSRKKKMDTEAET